MPTNAAGETLFTLKEISDKTGWSISTLRLKIRGGKLSAMIGEKNKLFLSATEVAKVMGDKLKSEDLRPYVPKKEEGVI